MLVRCTLVALAVSVSACSPAAAPQVGPTATLVIANPTVAATAIPAAAPTVAPTPASNLELTAPPTLVPAAPPVATAAVPLPTPFAPAWTPAPRTKTTGCVSQGGLPDPACTPGALDPRVSPATTAATICTSGYTATVRPAVAISDRIKRDQMAAYGIQGQPFSAYELDHLISLELGGAPADVANLWPEPWNGDINAHQKDAVETHLKREVCSGAVTLANAQRMIATDWVAVFRDKGLTPAP